MKKQIFNISLFKKVINIIFCALLAIVLFMPKTISADEAKVVRVGWYESPYNMTDQFGRKSGFAYEYQRKIASYTGWTYEYVEGSWSELLEMLKNGEIDLMSDVSYKEDRVPYMLYPSLPMGSEIYRLFVSRNNNEITSDNYQSINGKRVAVTKNSIQKDLFIDWAASHNIEVTLIEVTTPEDETMELVDKGEYDAFLTVDIYGEGRDVVPLWKIGSSDFYFVVNKDRPDLLNELDLALSLIQDENNNYNQQLYEKYLKSTSLNKYLNNNEITWLKNHGPIKVAYQDNYLAFCAKDPNAGELVGALKDYLDYASSAMENVDLEFETIGYPTAAAAIEALQKGEVDCMFPANLSDYDAEALGLIVTPALMTTEMDAVVRESEQKEFIKKEEVYVCVNSGNTNYEVFLKEHFPDWKVKYYPDTPTGLEAIAKGEADCVIISNYRFNNIAKQCEKLHLTTVYTGVNMEYYLAMREGDKQLYSILSKVTSIMPDGVVHAALTYHSTVDVKTSFVDLIMDNLLLVLMIALVVVLSIALLAQRSIKSERKAKEEHHKVDVLSEKVFVDPLTGVYNRNAFGDDTQQLQNEIEAGKETEFAIGVFDCDDLKSVNDLHGHDKGDYYIKGASDLITKVFKNSGVYRIGGDEFVVILLDENYKNREELIKQFNEAKEKINSTNENIWEKVNITMGMAVYDPDNDHQVNDTIRRADKIMYENKRLAKQDN